MFLKYRRRSVSGRSLAFRTDWLSLCVQMHRRSDLITPGRKCAFTFCIKNLSSWNIYLDLFNACCDAHSPNDECNIMQISALLVIRLISRSLWLKELVILTSENHGMKRNETTTVFIWHASSWVLLSLKVVDFFCLWVTLLLRTNQN